MADAEKSPEAPESTAKSGLMGKIVIASIIGLVILVETTVAFILSPSPDDVAARLRDEIKKDYESSLADGDLLDEKETGPVVEVELGSFSISIHDQESQSTYTIDCNVMATVRQKDETEFAELVEINQNRLREKIMIEFRNAKVEELAETELGLIKRRILEKSNALFGKPIIKAVLLPDFNYYQQ